MSAIEGISGRPWLVICLLGYLLLKVCTGPVMAQSVPVVPAPSHDELATEISEASTGVWLVTYGPGEIYWQRFGHNGIWIRDEDLGLDHVFNFGFFDFEQENFLLRFLQGRMLYFSAAQPAQSEFAQYIDENRSIRLQKLVLNEEQALRLADFLVREVQPQNRDYLYDYYLNNCSTRVRDALDFALDGLLQEQFTDVAAAQTFRQHTRRLTSDDFWLYLGLELGLGRPVDNPVSRWDEFFIPAELAEGVSKLGTTHGVVAEDVLLYQSSLTLPSATPPLRWPVYGLLALLVVALWAWLSRRYRARHSRAMALAWLVFTGVTGGALLFLWLGTDHAVTANNFNLLLFNPLALLLLSGKYRRPLAWILLFSALAALLQSLLPAPPGQYTADVVAAFLPFNLCAAWLLLRPGKPV
jgi:hypothetical protein